MNRNRRYLLITLGTIVALAACSSDKAEKHGPPTYIIYSPNAEPLNGGPLGKPTCEAALSGWFDRLSAAHDGHIPRDVFLQDAQVQFTRMDIDHNGSLVSEELDRFRDPYRQVPAAAKKGEGADGDEPKPQKGRKGGKSHDKGDAPQTDASLIDPVMSADANFDFRVTRDEFMQQAQDTFTRLDANHDGALDKAEVVAMCPDAKKK